VGQWLDVVRQQAPDRRCREFTGALRITDTQCDVARIGDHGGEIGVVDVFGPPCSLALEWIVQSGASGNGEQKQEPGGASDMSRAQVQHVDVPTINEA
jgi:hypothetical protein